MNYTQAREIKRIIQEVYEEGKLMGGDKSIFREQRQMDEKTDAIRKEKITRQAFLEFIEIFPENREVLPCDEPDY